MNAARYPLASCAVDIQRSVSGDTTIELRACARAVADAPVDGLLGRTDELARRWALMLVGARPLADLGAVPLGHVARTGPLLCALVLRALRSDSALQAEATPRDPAVGAQPSAELRLGWDADPREAVAAVDALRGVLWEALVHEAGASGLGSASPRLLSDLAERLAHVCSVALTRSLPASDSAAAHAPAPVAPARAAATGRGSAVRLPPDALLAESPAVRPPPDALLAESPAAEPPRAAPEPPRGAPAQPRLRVRRSRAVLIDEFEEPRARVAHTDGRALPWDIPLGGGGGGGGGGSGSGGAADHDRSAAARGAASEAGTISVVRTRPARERE
jgi:hypothetical protein